MEQLAWSADDPISQTLLIPLWARAVEQREPRPLLQDATAAAIVERLDYDWRRIRVSRNLLAQCVIRIREFDRFVGDFLCRHPAAIVAGLGCGLDGRFQRLDNGRVHWYDLDLPEVIGLRRRLLPESARYRYLASSVFDSCWMDELPHRRGDPVLFVAEALLPYLEGAKVKDLVTTLARRFPGAQLVTDTITPHAARVDNIQLALTGLPARLRWCVSKPSELEAWGEGIKLVESFSYFTNLEPRLGLPAWCRHVPLIRDATGIHRYELGTANQPHP